MPPCERAIGHMHWTEDTSDSRFALVVLSAGLAVLWAEPAGPTGGVYTQTRHGNSSTGVNRTPDWLVGSCEQCHVQHGGGLPNPYALFAPNTNALCTTAGCHGTNGPNGIYQGPVTYDASRHATSSVMVWPGPDPTVDPGAPRASRPATQANVSTVVHLTDAGTPQASSDKCSRGRSCYVCTTARQR
jgi:predicted CXXCH cytochrome family protein